MATYAIDLFALDSLSVRQFSFSSLQPASNFYWSTTGSSGAWYEDFTFDLSAGTSVEISDNDNEFEDDDVSWGFWLPVPDGQAQELKSDITIGGTVCPAGSYIENEWENTLVDDSGNDYRLVGVSINDQLVGYTFDGPKPPDGAVLQYKTGFQFTDYQSMVPCFTSGTLISTPTGDVKVEDLKVGDLVTTADNGAQAIRWIGLRTVSRESLEDALNIAPILIRANALGDGVPCHDTRYSPQHRILIRSKVAERMADAREVLIAAKNLVGLPGVEIDEDATEVTYVHLLLDRHEILFAVDAMTESLHLGPIAVRAMSEEHRSELFALFPDLLRDLDAQADGEKTLARKEVKGKRARKLIERNAKNRKSALELDEDVAELKRA